ncbi:MAG: hypothetical protein DDT19_01911 [Syntrophomonadaceae bacterium]|nr:hypothetical protein [Bacillota bacterium]
MANEGKIIIKADTVDAVKDIEKVTESTKRMESETGGAASKIKAHYLAISAAIAGAMVTVHQAWRLAEDAARFEEQMASLDALASKYNLSAKQIVSSVEEASRGLISMADAASVSAKALMMGMKPDQLVEFMWIVEATTNVTGASVAESFARITEAAAAGRERALRQMGIMVDLNDAHRAYAQSIGKTVDELSEMERQQASINAILKHGATIMQELGDTGDSTADKMERLRVVVQNLQLHLGALIIRVGVGLVGVFHALKTAAIALVAGIVAPFALVETGLNKIGIRVTFLNDILNKLDEQVEKSRSSTVDNFKAMVASSEKLMKARGPLQMIEDTERATKAAKKLAEEWTKTALQLERRITLMDLEGFEKQRKQLEFEVEDLIKKFGERPLIQKYFDAAMARIQADEIKKLMEEYQKWLMEEEEKIIRMEEKRYDAQKWLTDRINKLALSEVEYRKLKLREEYDTRAEILGWTVELQRAFQMEMARIDEEENERRLKDYMKMQKQFSEQLWQSIANTTSLIEGEQSRWLGLLSAGMEGMLTMNTEFYARQLEQLDEYYRVKIEKLIAAKESETAIMDVYNTHQIQREAILQQQRIDMYANTANAIFGILGALASFSEKNSRAMFFIERAYALSMAIINTAMAVTRALAMGPAGWFRIPWIVALGAAQVATIVAQTLKGPGRAPAAGVGRAAGISPVAEHRHVEPRIPEREERKVERPVIINVHVHGHVVDRDAFAREIIPSIQKAVSDGVR